MQTEGKYNVGRKDVEYLDKYVKPFGTLSNNRQDSYFNSDEMKSFAESIFVDGEIDFKKMMIFQMAMSNPLWAAMLLGKKKPADVLKAQQQNLEESKIGFRGLEHRDNEYLNDVAVVSDVKPNLKLTDRKERKSIEKTGDFSASKDSIIILAKNADGVEEDFSKDSQFSDIAKDGKIDFKEAKKQYKKLEEQTQNNLTSEGINNLIKDAPQKLDISNYEKYGIEVAYIPSNDSEAKTEAVPTRKGREQIEILKKNGILDEEGKVTLDEDKKALLKEQLNQNNIKDALKDLPEGKNVYVKTKDGEDGDTYNLAKIDRDGKITGVDAETKQVEHTEVAVADKKLKVGGVDDETLKKITTVKKDGSIELNLSKLDKTQYQNLMKEGIDYNQAAPLTIIDNAGEQISVRLTGDANTVNLKGKANAAISTENKELQINAEDGAAISDIKGADLEHLVIKGGKLDAGLGNLNKLQAVKIEKTNILKDIDVHNKDKANVAFHMSDVKTDKNITVTADDGNVDYKAADSTTGNITATGKNIATTLSRVKAKNVTTTAKEDVSAKFYKGTSIENAKIDAKNSKVTLNGASVKSTDLTGIKEKTEVYMSKNSKTDELSLNSDNPENIEFVGEDETVVNNIKEQIPNANVKKLGKEEGDVSTVDLLKKYFDFNSNDMARYKLDIEDSRYNAQPYGWGATPNAKGGGSNWFTRFLDGAALASRMYNYSYGNPYAGFGQTQPYNPWMVQGGYFG